VRCIFEGEIAPVEEQKNEITFSVKSQRRGRFYVFSSAPIIHVSGDEHAKGATSQRRPADAIGCAVMVGRIATGEITEVLKEPSGKVRSGQAGSKARAERLSQKERTAIAKKAAAQRWG
jgi:hypothetical protein